MAVAPARSDICEAYRPATPKRKVSIENNAT